MLKHRQSYPKRIALLFIIILLVAVIFIIFTLLATPQARKSDYTRISSEEYDTVFLSMFPITNYNEDDYSYYRAQTILKTSYNIPDLSTLQSYLKRIAASGNTVSTIYLGIRPEKIAADKLRRVLSEYPSVNYHIILSYPEANYWRSLSQQDLQEHLEQYRQLTDILLPESNISLYLFSQEWLLCNPANYEDVFLTNKDISHTLMVNCDRDHHYVITAENVDTVFADFSQLLKNIHSDTTVYADLSDFKIVFLGDSVIGNYTNSASIPGVVGGLTDAMVFNCGFGGGTAAHYPDCPVTLTDIVEALLQKDLSVLPKDYQVYNGVSEYIQDTSSSEQLCFIINYGLNDYFHGVPITTEDSHDTSSYSGALRTAIEKLQQAYPSAQIILMAPNFTSYFNNGKDYNSEVGGTLKDYVNAVISIGKEYNLQVLNNYADLNINAHNHGTYLVDGCHPNEATRFTIGERIARLFISKEPLKTD